MARLPVITAIGGISAAGRSSGHQAYRRLVLDCLSPTAAAATHQGLAALTARLRLRGGKWQGGDGKPVDLAGFLQAEASALEAGTLIRQLEPGCFAAAAESQRRFQVNSAGQLPTGFDPARLYNERSHPRGLQLTVFAASDAINALGLDWQRVREKVPPDQIAVYAGSGLGQLDYNGFGGMLQARLLGRKVSSKQVALGYAEMPADFVNAYLLGNLGTTGANVAACATFLYNLRQGLRDIQDGSHRIAIVGTSEAPLLPEVFDGFATMGALASDEALCKLDGLPLEQAPDFRRACRPFGDNAGFTLAESAQFAVLMADDLALELGAEILGAVGAVYINADGYKKSIAGPGLGNYLSMAKAAAATRSFIGEEGLKRRSYVHAHGTGTPQNRRTEPHIIGSVAKAFGIDKWPLTAVKAYLGHSLASSAGDQLMAALGAWAYSIIPGITTVERVADDVHKGNLDFLLQHREFDKMDAVLINSKGFGGNNASASILAPQVTEAMLTRRHGKRAMTAYQAKREATRQQIAAYETALCAGENPSQYTFDNDVLGSGDIELSAERIKVRGSSPAIDLKIANPYKDMC